MEAVKDRQGEDSFSFVKTKASINRDGLPKNFLNRFGQHVTGFFSGLDRVRFRATLRPLFCPEGPGVYLNYCKVLIKHFKGFAQSLSERVKKLAYERFEQLGRPSIYLPSSELSKEILVQELVAKEQIKEGPIALLSCVEPCLSFRVRGDRQANRLRLVMESAKCTHLYHYYQHPEIGLMHIRVQSWFPFSVDVCLNGRQWLARQLDGAGIGYEQRDNAFIWIEDCGLAQKLLNEQLRSNWPALMKSFLELAHPLHGEITAPMPGLSYYWSASQSEYATDVLFDHAQELQKLYPHFLRHAISSFQSPDVLRFLGRKVPQSSGRPHAGFRGEVSSRLQQRAEGVRIRHSLNGNSLKMYDKEGSVLRVETTIVRPTEFRVYRAKEGLPKAKKQWRPLRKGISDMYRRAQVCRAANHRYLEALACVTGSNSLLQEAAEVCCPIVHKGKRYRALNALAQKDQALLRALSRGEFALSGVRNADLRALFYPPAQARTPKAELRRRSAATTRQFALLRAHGLLRKLPRIRRYHLSAKGRRIITALLAACDADVEQLTKMAA
jgi:hypothetical protein